uniref:Uncharacterized protein n=1 Tax=Angiostrongylus cantonensis TaxID=6313 RepID=A0A0K0DC85_ANGCA
MEVLKQQLKRHIKVGRSSWTVDARKRIECEKCWDPHSRRSEGGEIAETPAIDHQQLIKEPPTPTKCVAREKAHYYRSTLVLYGMAPPNDVALSRGSPHGSTHWIRLDVIMNAHIGRRNKCGLSNRISPTPKETKTSKGQPNRFS